MKLLAPALGLLLGFIFGFVSARTLQPDRSPAPSGMEPVVVQSTELKDLKAVNDNLQMEVESLRIELSNYERFTDEYESWLKEEEATYLKKKNSYIAVRLKDYSSAIELEPWQEEKIGEIEWDAHEYWEAARGGKLNLGDHPPPEIETLVRELLIEDQISAYEGLLEKKADNSAERRALMELQKISRKLDLTEDQKDQIYSNLYRFNHEDTRHEVINRWNRLEGDRRSIQDQMRLWAMEGIVDDELFYKYEKELGGNG